MLEFKYFSAEEARKYGQIYKQKCLDEDRELFYKNLFGTIKYHAMRGEREAVFGNFYQMLEKVQFEKEQVFRALIACGFKPTINKVGALVIRF